MLDEAGRPIELGRGPMGVTYKSLDVDPRCPVTLKVISERYLGEESARLRFLREARAAAKVCNTNVTSVFHLGKTGENYFYAMEFVEEQTLAGLPLWPAVWVSRTQPSSTGWPGAPVRPPPNILRIVARVGIRLRRSDAQQEAFAQGPVRMLAQAFPTDRIS